MSPLYITLLLVFATPAGEVCHYPEPPFGAWLAVQSAYVRAEPRSASPKIGLLQLGDQVRVIACEPNCDAPKAWALLEPFGAIRVAFLNPAPTSGMAVAQSALATFVYGTVLRGGAPIYVEPDAYAQIVEKQKGGHVLAFRDDPTLLRSGWLRRPAGGYVQASRIRLAQPSAFSGAHDPALPMAFVIKRTALASGRTLERYERFSAERSDRTHVFDAADATPRSAVRLAERHPRPAQIGATEKWVHVDLDEQVLVAYEGERPVFATLIASGKDDTPTKTGLFRVWQKVIHASMHGSEEDAPYFVDEVPYSQYFYASFALHGSFWHDNFGAPTSHGCVNLSIADAAWLFAWSPPPLPQGWHSVLAGDPNMATLWVVIESSRAASTPEPPLACASMLSD